MSKKQTTVTVTASGAAPARASKPGTPRVKTVKHSKTPSIETASSAIPAPSVAAAPPVAEDRQTAIAKIAYGYWEARGFQHGNAHEDWLRAEAEYQKRSAV